MSTAKFEKLIDLIINEDQERAEQLFHEIVVEKSREIYENLMAEDMSEDLIDEVSMEEEGMEGMMEDDEEFTDTEELDGDMDVDMADDEGDMDMEMDDEEADMDAEEDDLEDRVVDLEDKLDELMAEFEAKMGGEEEEAEGEEEEEEGEEEEEEGEEEESGLMENVELSKVSVTHGDDGAQKKSPVAANAGGKGPIGNVVKPVKFSGEHETVPTAPKGPSNAYTKGEKMTGASYQNSPGGAKGVPGGKGEAAAKPVTKDAAAQTHSPVAESKRAVKRMVK